MRLHEHFLPQDMIEASKEFWCVQDLLMQLEMELENGQVHDAKMTSVDLKKSLQELTKLAEKRYQKEKMNQIAEMMGAAGIHIEVIRKLHHE